MPSIADAIVAGQKNAANSPGGVAIPAPNPPMPAAPQGAAPMDLPAGGGLPQRGMFPANMVLSGDRNDSSRIFRGSGARSAVFPFPVTPPQTSIITAAAATVEAAVAAVALSTNNLANPVQNKLNFLSGNTNLVISSDGNGNEIFTVANSGGDGLTHGRLPWEGDPSAVTLQDEFMGNIVGTDDSSTSLTGIGQLGWALIGSASSQGGFFGGAPLHIGQFAWGNSGSAGNAGWLKLPSNGSLTSAAYAQNGMALAEVPETVLSYVFKVEGDFVNQQFATTQKALYIGLMGTTIASNFVATPVSRPDVFIGVRYDTSTSAPSINDSFFTLEVVANKTFTPSARNNTQGTTLVTNVAPVQGVWHRLDIIFNATGKVTITLDGSTTNTLTTTVPTFSFTATMTGAVTDKIGLVNWTPSGSVPYNPWGAGSSVTIAGFTGGQSALNGTASLTGGGSGVFYFDSTTSSVGAGSGTVTLSGFPAYCPVFMMGNDDTSSPTASTMLLYVDYWSMTSNPNLGPTAPGTIDITKSRYF